MIAIKLLFLFTIFTTINAVPRKPDLSGKLRSEKFLKELQLSAKYEAEKDTATLNRRNFHLPNNTEPISYHIRLSTDIHLGHLGYEGDVTINLRALEATNSITLHSRFTIIERIDLFNPNGTLFQENVPYAYDSEVHFLEIPVIRGLEAGQELTIEISYQGIIRTEGSGFFRNSYFDPATNQQTWLATTQFWGINARQVFPCYDEPRYRTPIIVQIRHHQSYNAISNMPVGELTSVDGEYVTTVFEETPPIATYRLTFTISMFDFVENTDTDVVLRVYARPEAIQLGQADEGLRLGRLMFTTITGNLFSQVPFPLPKSDQIAITSSAWGGFEGWGLITHHESILLQSNNNTAAQILRENRIAHEYSHIYFGNLVTPASFTWLWLSEGFATVYETMLITISISERNGWESFLLVFMDQALTLDVQGLLPSLNIYAETPEEIEAKFTFGTWNKAAIVLRMFLVAVNRNVGSWAVWHNGVTHYLLSNEMGNVVPEDLYAGIQTSYDEEYPGSGLNFTELMSPWFDFEGYPIVTVRRSDEGLILTQEGFRTPHDELFGVPINYATATVPDFENLFADFWMTTGQLEIARDSAPKPWTDDDWIIINLRDSFYFITNYDDNLWNLIIDALNNDHEAIHFTNRGTLFADFHRFVALDFDISIVLLLRMMESLPIEFHPHVWNRASLGLALAEARLRGTEYGVDFMNFMRDIMSQIYGERAFEDDRSAMDLINDWSCLSGVQECLNDALNVLIEVIETGETSFEFNYQCNGLRAANESVWMDFYYSVVDSTSTEDRSIALRDLLCSENQDLVDFYLNQVLNTTNSLSIAERETILISAAVQHITSFNSLIELIQLNNVAISAITSISNLILELTIVTNNYMQGFRVLSLLQFTSNDDITVEFISQSIQTNLNFVDRNSDALRQWFAAQIK